jgi:hypothetical protein
MAGIDMAQRLALIIGNSVFRNQTLARLLKPDADVGALADELRGKLMGAELLVNLKKLELPNWLDLDFDDIGRLARLTAEAVQRGDLGYALLIGEKE